MYCEPYQSCSLLGALRLIANLQNVVSIVHGPTGCSFYARNSIIRLNGYYSAKHRIPIPVIYSTNFNENDTIFGGSSKLQKAIDEVIFQDNPEAIFIFGCCVSEIIGEDIDVVAEKAKEKYQIPIIPIHSAGFKGDHKVGMKMANDILFDNFIKTDHAVKNSNRINILGDFDYFNRSSLELKKIIRMMKKNIEATFIPGNCTLEELSSASSAAINIITCNNASKHLAKKMQDNYGIPYIGGDANLYGIDAAYNTYGEIFDFFNEDKAVLNVLRDNAKERISISSSLLQGCKAVVVAGTRRALGYSNLLKEIGIDIEFVFTESFEENIKDDLHKYTNNVMCNEYSVKLFEKIDEIRPDFVFSTLPEIVAPNHYVYRNDEDYTGFDGTVKLVEYLVKIKQSSDSPSFVRMEN